MMNQVLHKVMRSSRGLGDREVWWSVGAGLALLHLGLTWRLLHQPDHLVLHALFWLAILGLWPRFPQRPKCHPRWRSVGWFVLGVVLVNSLSLTRPDAWFVRLFPALAIGGLSLVVAGVPRPITVRLGLLLVPLMLPKGLTERLLELAIGQPAQVLTAQFATLVLHYIGYDAVQKNTLITVNQGTIDVLFQCTGLPLLVLLLQLVILFFVVFSLTPGQRYKIIVMAGLIAFFVSGLRVAMMAVVVSDHAAFDYWHGGQGAQLFSTGAIVILGWLCQRSLPRVQID